MYDIIAKDSPAAYARPLGIKYKKAMALLKIRTLNNANLVRKFQDQRKINYR